MSDTTTDDDSALGEHAGDGPSSVLQDLLTVALAGPSVLKLHGTPAYGDLVDRISGCQEWSDLEAADRELLQRGLDETRAGLSPQLIDPAAYQSNWLVEDYLAELEDAPAAPAEADEDEAKDLPGLGDEWVGLE